MSKPEDKIFPDAEADGAERRRHPRVDISLRARFLTSEGVEKPCLVANISAGGALCRTLTPPAENESVVLYIDRVGRFEGKVVRSGRRTFAVDYRGRRSKSNRTADALTIALNSKRKVNKTAAPRIKQDAPALVILENGETRPCSILDISLTGASIEIEPKPPLGAQITLGKMAAKVVRRHETGVAVVFSGSARKLDEAIDQTVREPDAGMNFAVTFGRKGPAA